MKKILVSLGLILTLVLCCAFVPVNAAEECAHEKVTFQYYLEGQVAPTNCKESGIAKVKCDVCKAEVYRKIVGKHNIEEIVTDATCEANQKVEIKCTLCDYKEETVEIANTKLTHNWVVTEFEATCGRPSGTASKCSLCGEEKEFTADVDGDPALEHEWEDTKVVEATCQEKGYTLQTCKNCKETQKVNVGEELGDHVKGEKPVSVLKEADCKNPGVGKYECALCGEEMGYQTIPAQHKYGEYEVTDAAKCGVNAKGIKKCLVCGVATAKEEIPNTALEHNYVDTVKDATCTEPQWAGPVCSLCGHVDEEKAESLGEALGHDWDEVIVEATCDRSSGIVRKCTRCDVEPEFIPFDSEDDNYKAPLNHMKDGKDAYVKVEGYAATCKTKGLTDGKKCSLCGDEVKGTEIPVDADAHKEVVAKVLKAATCTVAGVGKYACELCKADLGYKTIPASHNFSETVTKVLEASTCTKAGKGEFACLNEGCNEKVVKDLPLAKHDYELVPVQYEGANQCEKAPAKAEVCKVCNAKGEIKSEGKAPGHKWGEEVIKDADCENGQSVGIYCTVCEKAKTEVELTAPLGHKWDKGTVVAPTCTEKGYTLFVCTVCGDTKKEAEKPAAGHAWNAGTVVAPTCTNKGYTLQTCSTCKETQKVAETEIDPDNHELELVKELKAATCTVAGVGKYACKYCKDTDTTTYASIEAKCNFGELVIDKAPTCGKDGEGHVVCTVCGKKETAKVADYPALKATGKHTAEEIITPATCTDPAKVEEKCSVCGTTIKTIANVKDSKPLGHDYTEKFVAATCTNPSQIVEECTRCDWSNTIPLDETYVGLYQPALNHMKDGKSAEEVVKGYAQTCSTDGLTDGKKCTLCNEMTVKQTKIEKDGTTHKNVVVKVLKAATCTVAGVGKYACEYCGKEAGYETIPAKCTFGELVIDKAPTCGKDGEGHVVCTVCGKKEAAKVADYPALKATGKHTLEETITAATCTAAAKVEEKCTVCGYVSKEIADVKDSKPLGHDKVEVFVDATCTTAAYIKVACSRCDVKFEDVKLEGELADLAVAPLNHKKDGKSAYVTVKGYAATCSSKGLTDGQKCSLCGHEVKGTEIPVDEDAHKLEITKVLKAATCTVAGVAKYECSLCDYYEYGATDLDHKFGEYTVTKAATCKEAGEKEAVCTLCGAKDKKAIDKLDHKLEETVKDATCTSYELVVLACSVCGHVEEEIDVIGSSYGPHDFEEEVVVECGKNTIIKKVCKVCEHEEEDEVADSAVDHKWNAVEVKGTCKVEGYTAKVCENCGEEIDKVVTGLVADNHDYKTLKVIKEATCTESGVARVKCNDCEEETYIAIVADHAFGEEVNVDASGALVYVKCTKCTAIKTVAYFGKKDVAEGQVFVSLEKFAEAEAAK